MSDNDFLISTQVLKTPSPRVFFIQSEKKIKLEKNSADMTEDIEDSPSSNANNLMVKINRKDLMENSLNSSSLWTSTENSFVQVTDKLLHRGIQTEQSNNQLSASMGVINSQRSPNVLMSNSMNLSLPIELNQSKRESM